MFLGIFSLPLIFHFSEYKTEKDEIFIINNKKIKFIINVILLKKKNEKFFY